ncbi:stage III sporulation protein AE [Crassaminicella indica]|uniref:Stage III sporulation protein AE n=1 Tax=Crassaminicella indica TaxID=2855394 RepID=A0ABX8RB29_9CLOT|nr:stage III sporulation protein AE [Crassaminicella indica]QXM06016.1 stage III sporulation protein AE [Crassaminicella indica]
MKRSLIILILLLGLNINNVYATNIENKENDLSNDMIVKQLENINMIPLEELIKSINNDNSDYFPKINFKKMIISLIKGEASFTLKDLLNGLLKMIFKETVANSSLLAKLIVLSIICAFLHNLSNAFASESVGKLAYTACYLVIVAIAIKSFSIATSIGIDAIDEMISFMQALLPILLTLLMSMGAVTSTAIFQPVIVASVSVVSTLMQNIILPMIFFSVILSIVNNLSSKIHISKLASLLKQTCIILIGFILTIFTGIITIQGLTASTADGITIRTAKFAVDRFIPVVGGFVSDAFDTILGCSLLIKNAVGALGIILLIIIIAMPLLKILTLIFIYKMTAAIIEPITENQLVNCLNDMSNAMVLILGTVISVAIMFFFTVTIIVGAGNITLMMR